MIPKVIHCCWFGSRKKPAIVERCIASWRKFAPDWEIREWKLSDFSGVSQVPRFFTAAVAAGKWAFASDWARIWIVYNEGGLYFDTDLELIRPIDDLAREPFFACEWDSPVRIGTGLGFACEKGAPVLREILDLYESLAFDPACHLSQTSPAVQTEIVLKHAEIRILPECVFNPKHGMAQEAKITAETRGVHHFTATWFNWRQKLAYRWYPKVKKWFRG